MNHKCSSRFFYLTTSYEYDSLLASSIMNSGSNRSKKVKSVFRLEMIIRDSPGLESRDWTDFVRDSNPGIQLWIPGFRDFEIQ